MTRTTLPWLVRREPGVMPARRASMPVQEYIPINGDVRLETINRPGVPPHFHVHSARNSQLVLPKAPMAGMQVVQELTPMGLLPCEVFECEWFLYGREGEDAGKPFKHPQGVRCGDFERCTDDNCPCTARVLNHGKRGCDCPPGTHAENGHREGHVAPCRYCDQSYRRALNTGVRPIVMSEAVDRMHEGVDTLARILTRGL